MESVLLYNSMRRRGTGPVFFHCYDALDVNLGTHVHTQTILVCGFGSDLYVGNALVSIVVFKPTIQWI